MRVTLIHNPGSGDDSHPSRGQLEALIKEAGHKVRYQSVRERGWSKALKKQTDLVAVAGGDGTVGKVVRRLVGRGIPVAVLPIGTANNIASTLGIAGLSVMQLIPSWASSRHLAFDAGAAKGPWGSRYFVEAVGVGMFSTAMGQIDEDRTLEQLPNAEVRVTYTLQLLREFLVDCKTTRLKASIDGKDISGDYLLFEAMLMRYIGPNLDLAPNVDPDDGAFDVVLVAEKDRSKLHEHLGEWQEGNPWPAEFRTLRGAHLELQWTGFPIHIDDKRLPAKGRKKSTKARPVELTIERKAIDFLVPKDLASALR
ncbi:MAG: diacylglycerol/lipid kinase family protein [Candidatus Binatia bacterium]